MVSNIFIVQSPFQLLSAIEGANYFKGDKNTLIVCYSPESVGNQQISMLMDYFRHWDDVIIIPPPKFTFQMGVNLIFTLRTVVKTGIRPERIFIGEYRAWQMIQYFHTLQPKECFLLDDGNITIELQKKYLSTNRVYGSIRFRGRLLKWVLTFFMRLKQESNIVIHLFTCFDLQPFSCRQLVLRHSFEFAKLFSRNKEIDSSVVFFFGCNFSGLGLLSIEREIELISTVKLYYEKANLKLAYIPHRRESKDKIKLIQERLKLNTICFDFPAEVEMIKRETLPYGIASFYSTVLFTLPRICKFLSIDAFEFPLSELPKQFHSEVEQMYLDIRSSGNIQVRKIL